MPLATRVKRFNIFPLDLEQGAVKPPAKSGRGRASLFTRYNPYETASPAADSQWLEETKPGAFPAAVRDEDQDGYREISHFKLSLLVNLLPPSRPLPLASYFDDRKYIQGIARSLQGSLAFAVYSRRFAKAGASPEEAVLKEIVLKEVKEFLAEEDLGAALKNANFLFQLLAVGRENPLQGLRLPLSLFLNGVALHSRHDLDDSVFIENDFNGFSIAADHRLRIDCGIFAQMSHEILKGIKGLEFSYIFMKGQNLPIGHVLLLVSDPKGHHLIVDNNQTIYFENQDPEKFIVERYGPHGFEKFSRSADWESRNQNKPFQTGPIKP